MIPQPYPALPAQRAGLGSCPLRDFSAAWYDVVVAIAAVPLRSGQGMGWGVIM